MDLKNLVTVLSFSIIVYYLVLQFAKSIVEHIIDQESYSEHIVGEKSQPHNKISIWKKLLIVFLITSISLIFGGLLVRWSFLMVNQFLK